MNKTRFVFVEGIRDENLLKKIFKKCFKYQPKFYSYADKQSQKTRKLINNFNNKNIPYLFITDFDPDQFSCITKRKDSRIQKYGVNEKNIIVVKSEIESWYAAGSYSRDFNKKNYKDEEITKEIFYSLLDNSSYSAFILNRICDSFNTVRARKNSQSFKYFYEKVKRLECA